NNGNGTVTFTIPNEAGAQSFFYHLVPNRTCPTGPMRTIKQTFQWTEKIDMSNNLPHSPPHPPSSPGFWSEFWSQPHPGIH
ncbi:MAG: hypothetical protein NTW07_02780, partial [candidate division Zixibacteria bacterium]|nr:hypothetical protein [candidate division Zixibacteria bacterium]